MTHYNSKNIEIVRGKAIKNAGFEVHRSTIWRWYQKRNNYKINYIIIDIKLQIYAMNRQEIIRRLRGLKLPKNEYYVLSGASLVLRGIREICSDIDLCISEELFSDVKDRLKMTPDKLNSCNFYQLSDALEIVVDKKDHFNLEEGDEFNLEDIKTILAFKESRNLLKDQQDIANIKKIFK